MASASFLFLALQFLALFSVFYMQRIYATYGKQGDQEGTHGVRPRRRRRCGTTETPSTRWSHTG